MPTVTTVVEFPEILAFASHIGMSWNEANEHLVGDEVPPMYECNSRDYNIGEIKQNAYDWSDESVRIMTEFCEYHNLVNFVLIND